MNNEEAKFILSGYRPGGRDAGEAMFAAALQQAHSDPLLGAWLARAQAHDIAVSAKLAEIRPPAGLREAIFAGARVSETPRAVWRRPAWLAIAAAAAVIIGGSVAFWPNRAVAQATELANFALADTAKDQHGGHGEAAGALQALLSQPTTRLGHGLPINFAKLKKTGCRDISFGGKDVLEICFGRNGEMFHIYVVRTADFPKLPMGDEPRIDHRGDLCCASWSDAANGYHYVVVSDAGPDAIRNLL